MPAIDLRPWRPGVALWWSGAVLFGGAAILTAWVGASGTVELDTQYRWLNLAVVGVIAIGVANCMWLLGARHAVATYRKRLQGSISDEVTLNRMEGLAPAPSWVDQRVSIEAGSKYHHGECRLIVGKVQLWDTEARHIKAGRQPCRICES